MDLKSYRYSGRQPDVKPPQKPVFALAKLIIDEDEDSRRERLWCLPGEGLISDAEMHELLVTQIPTPEAIEEFRANWKGGDD